MFNDNEDIRHPAQVKLDNISKARTHHRTKRDRQVTVYASLEQDILVLEAALKRFEAYTADTRPEYVGSYLQEIELDELQKIKDKLANVKQQVAILKEKLG